MVEEKDSEKKNHDVRTVVVWTVVLSVAAIIIFILVAKSIVTNECAPPKSCRRSDVMRCSAVCEEITLWDELTGNGY